jgi:Ca2+-binding RTX toxin-like protein
MRSSLFDRAGRNSGLIEPLESRRMLAADVSVTDDGIIVVNGTSGDDEIVLLSFDHSHDPGFVFAVQINGQETEVATEGPGGRLITGIQINGRAGDDDIRLFEYLGPSAPVTVNGGAGDDYVKLQDNRAYVIGGAGDDEVELGDSGRLLGFEDVAGNDTFNVGTGRGFPVHNVIDMNQYPGLDNVYGAWGGMTVIGNDLHNHILARSDAATLLGMGGNDTLIGTSNNDRLEGGDGQDVLIGNAGADTLDGGDGQDRGDDDSEDSVLSIEKPLKKQ